MKKIKYILGLIIAFAITHSSFTVKLGSVATGVVIANKVNAQVSFFVTANCHNNNWELNKWMSPTNDCNNRFVAMKFSPDSSTFSQHQVIWDSLAKITSSLNTNNKVWTMASNGNIEPVPYSSFMTTYSPTTFTASRAINSATYQVSATKQATVFYTIRINCVATIGGASSGTVALQYSTNGGSTWVEVGQVENSNTVTLAVVLNSNTTQTGQVSGIIPAGAIVRMNQSSTGTTTITFVRGQETY